MVLVIELKFIKKNILAIICSIIILFVGFNINKISDKLANVLEKNPKVITESSNQYKKDDDFLFVQNTSNFVPLSYSQLLNIYYTITNSGYESFTFYCPSEYKDCIDDVGTISDDPEILTYINNFVHPYNSFSNIETTISESGEINVKINYLYSKEEIEKINEVVDKIYNENITDGMSDYEKIKTIHDYIINNAKYDVERNTNGTSNYTSYKATGPLIEGYATCNGYTDAMAIFLEKMNIKNFKIATELMQSDISGHVWNAVFLDGNWYHLDLTWDDPVSDDGKDYLQHKYFLISSSELKTADAGAVEVKEHTYSKRVYPEMTES
jgi:hypothetical protein